MNDPERWARASALFHDLADAPEAAREAKLAELADDPELVAEVRSLLSADRDSDRVRTRAELDGAADATTPGRRVGAYRLVDEIARGGMGVVYRAERADGAFDRQVAIKLVRPDLVSPALGAHFLAERRILAALDHRGIAQLLDAGSTEDGQLFLVLELVEGERLDRWAVGRTLNERLACFLAVCEAVEHAHGKLILHRDLKPANILVTSSGQPKLLDFGIARLLGERDGPGEATRLGLRPLTPDYASPEQLRGEVLSTASDVYSLGVVLFELLSGRLPYEHADTTSPEERARRIESDPLPRASALSRQTASLGLVIARGAARDLDAITAHALAPEPDCRYRSVAELAADVRRHLEGRSIEARPPSFAERSSRFVWRHRVAVAVAAAFIAILIGATAVSLRQAAVASAERSRAEASLADLRRLANVLLFDVHDAIVALPGATSARALLIGTGVRYLGTLETNASRDPAVARDLAKAYTRLATLQRATTKASLGETGNAARSFERALAMWQLVVERDAFEPLDRFEYARTLRSQAETLFVAGRATDAAAAARLACAALEQPETLAPPGEDLRLGRAAATVELGYFTALAGDLENGAALARSGYEALEVLSASTRGSPTERATLEALEIAAARVSDIESNRPPGGFARAIPYRTRALELARGRARRAPDDPRVERALAGHLAMLGSFHEGVGDLAAADTALVEALGRMTAFAARDPADKTAAHTLENIRIRASFVAGARGDLVVAHRYAATALGAIERLRLQDPEDLQLRFLEGNALRSLGSTALKRTGTMSGAAAAAALREARERFAAARIIFAELRDRRAIVGGESALVDEIDRQLAEIDAATTLRTPPG